MNPPNRNAVAFTDGGTAFMNALETRQSFFGTLSMHFARDPSLMPFSQANLARLLQLDEMFEKLDITYLDRDNVLLLFSAKVTVLNYSIALDYVETQDLDSADISTKDLRLKMITGNTLNNWSVLPIAFLNRVAALGHFERLNFSIILQNFNEKNAVVAALIRVIRCNPRLKYFSLSGSHLGSSWTRHFFKRYFRGDGRPPWTTHICCIYLEARSF